MTKKIDQLKKNTSFCTLAWTGLSISPTGTVSPCCLFEKAITANDKFVRINESKIDQFYNNSYMKDIRQKMLDGEKVQACRQCYENEAHNGISMRIRANNEHYEVRNSYLLDEEVTPQSLDLKLNNLCNLKCRMCQPQDSNQIYTEFKKIISKEHEFSYFENTKLKDAELNIDLKNIIAWEETQEFQDEFVKLLPGLRKISLVGGEPLLLDVLYRLLDKAIELDHAKHIYIVITTNLMSLKKEKLKTYFSNFERVLMNISLDAIGTELNYIRYPSNFEKIMTNLKELYKAPETNKKVFFAFALTAQAYNALYLTDIFMLVDSMRDQGFKFSNTPISFTHLAFPEHLNMRMLPQNVRVSAINKLKKYLVSSKYARFSKGYYAGIRQLIGTLEKEYLPNSEKLQKEFLYYTDQLDKMRNQKFEDFLPELHLAFRESNIKISPPTPSYHLIREEGWELAKQDKLNKAILKFQKSAMMSKDKYLDYREMAWMMLALRRFNDAYHAYQKAFDLNPTDKNILKGITLASYECRDLDFSKKIFSKAIEYNPDDLELKQLEEVLFI